MFNDHLFIVTRPPNKIGPFHFPMGSISILSINVLNCHTRTIISQFNWEIIEPLLWFSLRWFVIIKSCQVQSPMDIYHCYFNTPPAFYFPSNCCYFFLRTRKSSFILVMDNFIKYFAQYLLTIPMRYPNTNARGCCPFSFALSRRIKTNCTLA